MCQDVEGAMHVRDLSVCDCSFRSTPIADLFWLQPSEVSPPVDVQLNLVPLTGDCVIRSGLALPLAAVCLRLVAICDRGCYLNETELAVRAGTKGERG